MTYRFETNAIHSGQEPDKETGAVIPALHLASTYRQDGVGNHKGFEYSRTGNPTRNSLEQQIASLRKSGARSLHKSKTVIHMYAVLYRRLICFYEQRAVR